MKHIIIALLLLAAVANAAPTRKEYGGRNSIPVQSLIGSEHSPLIYSGSDTISSSANFGTYTTDWLQIGFSPNVSDTGNRRVVEHNGEFFTLSLLKKHAFAVAADCCSVTDAWFETADSSGAVIPYWNADSANVFIDSGNYNRSDYGTWTFEPDTITTHGYDYALKVLRGGYIRFNFATTIQDCTIVEWQLRLEH